MSIEWNSYIKANFAKVGEITITPANETDFPTVQRWKYVLARCNSKNKDDDFVQEGAHYVIRWPDVDSELKCFAPNPPFETGENTLIQLLERIKILEDKL
ncbi:MAG TPA: hypothetical protein VFG10_09315 [Saprospiraceae bacterium]|nr:hypothetical protein [Saprospiraceae bacterium]